MSYYYDDSFFEGPLGCCPNITLEAEELLAHLHTCCLPLLAGLLFNMHEQIGFDGFPGKSRTKDCVKQIIDVLQKMNQAIRGSVLWERTRACHGCPKTNLGIGEREREGHGLPGKERRWTSRYLMELLKETQGYRGDRHGLQSRPSDCLQFATINLRILGIVHGAPRLAETTMDCLGILCWLYEDTLRNKWCTIFVANGNFKAHIFCHADQVSESLSRKSARKLLTIKTSLFGGFVNVIDLK